MSVFGWDPSVEHPASQVQCTVAQRLPLELVAELDQRELVVRDRGWRTAGATEMRGTSPSPAEDTRASLLIDARIAGDLGLCWSEWKVTAVRPHRQWVTTASHDDVEEHPVTAEDEIRIIRDAVRLLGDDVAGTLWSRGWSVSDLEADADSALEWFWPPTAPAGYGRQPEPGEEDDLRRYGSHAPRETPWTAPTRVTRLEDGWQVEYGAAIAQTPARAEVHTDDRVLLADLERIECWPMRPEEARKIRALRVIEVTTAMAHDDHYRACTVTEPYASRLHAIEEHRRYERVRGHKRGLKPPDPPRRKGDLASQMVLAEAAAWASALRTARAGGRDWGMNGREPR